ncbi:hypothetical protein Tco_0749509 [Tanacetum coccineum]|uniref:Uncharacterized protein n=1 Tax=Tanacetum coccineum TaxID=301880 RepID=A0ABQ4Z1P3_9ASTR
MLKMRREKLNERLVQGKPHPSPVPKHTLETIIRQEGHDRTNGSNRQKNDARRKKKRENKDSERLNPTREDQLEKLKSISLHHSFNDKVSYRQWNRNDDDQERNPLGLSEDGRSARASPGKKNHPSLDTSL